MSAITLASLVLAGWGEPAGLDPAAAAVLPYLTAGISLLMVSKIRYDTLPKISRRAIQREPWKFLFFVLAVVIVFVTGGKTILPLMLLFVGLGLVRWLFGVIRRIVAPAEKEEETVEPTHADT